MPLATAAKLSLEAVYRQMDDIVASAAAFTPPDRAKAVIRKWLKHCDIEEESEDRAVAMAADAMLLSADLLLSEPAANGSNAFDRLARTRPQATPADRAALAALRQSRYRLLVVDGDTSKPQVHARDVVSGEALRIVFTDLAPLTAGTPIFARAAPLGDGLYGLPGAVTPLDPAAFTFANSHPSARQTGVTAGSRWAEAIYGHVVRYGTLDVPGVNRPSGESGDDPMEAEGGPLFALAMAWAELHDSPPDENLLQRTRQLTDLPTIIDALIAATLSRDVQEAGMAQAFERLLLVQL